MSYKSILLHVEPTEAGRARLRQTAGLAHASGARLIGVGARWFDPMPDPVGLSVVRLKETIAQELAEAEGMFREETRSLETPARWHAATEAPTQALLRYACGADLIVSGSSVQAEPVETRAGAADLIMAAGAPVLTMPAGAQLDARTVVVGWKDTREARRAIWDALPLLTRAERVLLLRFTADTEAPSASLAEAAERLRAHGARVEAELRPRAGGSVAIDIVAAAQAAGAGLVVVGGYGRSRFEEWALGGVTHGLLTHAPVCVLYSH